MNIKTCKKISLVLVVIFVATFLCHNSILHGKTINVLGDSFTRGNSKWHTYIAYGTGCFINNYGVSGSAVVQYKDEYSEGLLKRYCDMEDHCDAVIIFGGINDSWVLSNNRCTVGNMASTDTNTLYGAAKALCEGLIEKYPTTTIVALLPPEIIKTGDFWDNASGIDTVCEVLIEVYTKYDIPYLDLRTASTITTQPEDVALYNENNGTDMHWNAAGHKKASHSIQEFLEAHIK